MTLPEKVAHEYAKRAVEFYAKGLKDVEEATGTSLPEKVQQAMKGAYYEAIKSTYLDGWNHIDADDQKVVKVDC